MTAADMVQAVSDDAGGGLEAARPVSSLSAAHSQQHSLSLSPCFMPRVRLLMHGDGILTPRPRWVGGVTKGGDT